MHSPVEILQNTIEGKPATEIVFIFVSVSMEFEDVS